RRGGSRPLRRDLARGARVVPRGRTARRIMMRVVAIAAGSHIFGAAHVPALEATGAEVVGVYDVRPEGAEAVASPRGWRVAPTLDELLAIEADVAVIAAPHPLHADLAERALDAGLHVLVEKPLAARPSEARRIVAA